LGLSAFRIECRDLTPDYGEVNVNIAGNGFVTSRAPAGLISCGSDCVGDVPLGLPVTLSASAFSSSKFVGWEGDCAAFGTNDCTLTVTGSMNVTAAFADLIPPPKPVLLTVHVKADPWSAPLTSGGVTSSPGAINCQMHNAGPDSEISCVETFSQGTSVTLTATPGNPTSSFMGFSGGCSSTSSTCVVTLNGDVTVDATFKSIIN
jgi:hypothetical protein